jgi:hypothetical protein
MEVFIKLSSIGQNLGENFSLHGSLTPSQKTNLTRIDLLGGYVLQVGQNEIKVIITPLDVKATPKELNINSQNQIEFSAQNFYNTDYRPLDPTTSEITEFRSEIFPTYKIEEIGESIIGDRILIDFLDKSIAFTIISSSTSQEEAANIKIGSWSLPDSEGVVLSGPSFIFKKYNDNSIPPMLEIHDPYVRSFYRITKEGGDDSFVIPF